MLLEWLALILYLRNRKQFSVCRIRFPCKVQSPERQYHKWNMVKIAIRKEYATFIWRRSDGQLKMTLNVWLILIYTVCTYNWDIIRMLTESVPIKTWNRFGSTKVQLCALFSSLEECLIPTKFGILSFARLRTLDGSTDWKRQWFFIWF